MFGCKEAQKETCTQILQM